jgi:hypothetical protein
MRPSSNTNEAKLPLTTIMYLMGYKSKLLKRAGNKYATYFWQLEKYIGWGM